MPRVHQRKTNQGLVSASLMLRASVAKDFGINYPTLTRYCKKFTSEEISNTAISRPSTKIGYQRNRKFFSDEQEEELEKYLLLASAAAVSAVGNSVPPFFLLPRVHFKDYFIRDGPIGCKGWMTEELFVAFLKHFHNHVKSTKESPCLLLLDNHSSHLSIEGLNFAKENGIVMLSFTPHCTHRLQPLDRSIYGPLRKYINNTMDQWMVNHPGQSMTIYDIPGIIAQAFPLAVSPSDIVHLTETYFRTTILYHHPSLIDHL